MDLYLIRHTTPEVDKGICYGQTDLPLKNSFPEELFRLKQHLPESFDKLYTSPLQRCKLLAEHLHEAPEEDNRLMEMDFGDWEMKAWAQIPKNELDPWMADFVSSTVPNGEAFTDLIKRSEAAMQDVIEAGGEKVAVVAHAGIIRACLGHFLAMSPEHYFRLDVSYGGVSRVKVKGPYYTVQYINR